LEEADKELLENNRVERNQIEDEIKELRLRNVSEFCLSSAGKQRSTAFIFRVIATDKLSIALRRIYERSLTVYLLYFYFTIGLS